MQLLCGSTMQTENVCWDIAIGGIHSLENRLVMTDIEKQRSFRFAVLDLEVAEIFNTQAHKCRDLMYLRRRSCHCRQTKHQTGRPSN